MTTTPPITGVLTFGILTCHECAVETTFIGPTGTKHITDAYCSECGYTYGRARREEHVEVAPGRRELRHVTVPAISDEVARAARATYLERHGRAPTAPAPREPDELRAARAPSRSLSYAEERIAAARSSTVAKNLG